MESVLIIFLRIETPSLWVLKLCSLPIVYKCYPAATELKIDLFLSLSKLN